MGDSIFFVSLKAIINFLSLIIYYKLLLLAFRFSAISDCVIHSVFFFLLSGQGKLHGSFASWQMARFYPLSVHFHSVSDSPGIVILFCGRFFLHDFDKMRTMVVCSQQLIWVKDICYLVVNFMFWYRYKMHVPIQ